MNFMLGNVLYSYCSCTVCCGTVKQMSCIEYSIQFNTEKKRITLTSKERKGEKLLANLIVLLGEFLIKMLKL